MMTVDQLRQQKLDELIGHLEILQDALIKIRAEMERGKAENDKLRAEIERLRAQNNALRTEVVKSYTW